MMGLAIGLSFTSIRPAVPWKHDPDENYPDSETGESNQSAFEEGCITDTGDESG